MPVVRSIKAIHEVYAGGVKPLPAEDLEHILRHTGPLWDAARGRRIFISGGTGFFGAWLLESLAFCNRRLDLDLSATVLSRDPVRFLRRLPHLAHEDSVRLLHGDVRDFAFPAGSFDYVIHGATPTSGDEARPPELPANMVAGAARMLEMAKARGTRRFLFTSSGAVYGEQPDQMSHILEDYPGSSNGLTAYGEAKLESERVCRQCAQESGIELALARCFTFVGPHLPLDLNFAIGNFIGDALAGRTIRIGGDGTPVRSYLYAADLAIWLWTLLLQPVGVSSEPQVYNVGSGEAISIEELARMVVEELNSSLRVEIAQTQKPGAPRQRYVPDVTKAEKQLGLRPLIPLRQAIRRTADWYSKTS